MPAASRRVRAAMGRGRLSFLCITKSLIWEEMGSGSVAEGAILVLFKRSTVSEIYQNVETGVPNDWKKRSYKCDRIKRGTP